MKILVALALSLGVAFADEAITPVEENAEVEATAVAVTCATTDFVHFLNTMADLPGDCVIDREEAVEATEEAVEATEEAVEATEEATE